VSSPQSATGPLRRWTCRWSPPTNPHRPTRRQCPAERWRPVPAPDWWLRIRRSAHVLVAIATHYKQADCE